MRPLLECTEEFWDEVLDINLSGTWRGIKAAVPYMEKRGGGSIVNVSSFCSIVPTAKNGVYSISKAAVDSLTKVMAAELAPKNIRVNAVLPGFIATQMTADKVEYNKGYAYPADFNEKAREPWRYCPWHCIPCGRWRTIYRWPCTGYFWRKIHCPESTGSMEQLSGRILIK
ncbi:MAG: SDR family NAD(P)-dependent oxidoreductase [Anaerovoracaceae bacterium]